LHPAIELHAADPLCRYADQPLLLHRQRLQRHAGTVQLGVNHYFIGPTPDLDDIAPGDILHILPFTGQARLIGVQLILSQFRIQVELIEDRPHLARLPRLQPQRGLDGKVIRVKEGIEVLPNSVH